MVSYVKKKGIAAVLLSTMYHNKMVDENTRKEKITHPSTRPSDVDTMDQMVDTYTCKCKT